MSLYFSLSSTQKLGDIRFRVPADEVYADTRNGPISTALGKKQKYETDQQTDIARQWCYTHHWFPDGSNSWANSLWPIAVPRCFPKKPSARAICGNDLSEWTVEEFVSSVWYSTVQVPPWFHSLDWRCPSEMVGKNTWNKFIKGRVVKIV